MQHSNIWDVFSCFWIAQLIQQLQIKSRNRLGISGSDHLERFVWWEPMSSVLHEEVTQKGLLEQYYRWLLFCLYCSQALSLSANFLPAFALLSYRSHVPLWPSFPSNFWDFPAWPEQARHLDSSVSGKTRELLANTSEPFLQNASTNQAQPGTKSPQLRLSGWFRLSWQGMINL